MVTIFFFVWIIGIIYNGWDAVNNKASLADWVVIVLWPISYTIFRITDIFTKKDVLLLFAMFLLCLVACYVSIVAYNSELYTK